MEQHPVILFDGVCNFCNSIVSFVIKRERKQTFRFAPLQATAGKKILELYGLPQDNFKSFIFIEKGIAYMRSTAALKVCKYLRWPWPLCYAFILIPVFLRDALYNWIAANRYKWFGTRDECIIPGAELKARFLNDTDNGKEKNIGVGRFS